MDLNNVMAEETGGDNHGDHTITGVLWIVYELALYGSKFSPHENVLERIGFTLGCPKSP
jgi:hypothetical protein